MSKLIIHKYKGFNIVKTGTKSFPWNIYKEDGHGFGSLVGCGRTIKDCKFDIDYGNFSEARKS